MLRRGATRPHPDRRRHVVITAVGIALASGLTAGLISTPHCAVMCGPLCAYACRDDRTVSSLASYQVGRLISYALVGALAGVIGGGISAGLTGNWGSIALAWLLSLTLLIAGVVLWRRPRSASEIAVAPALSVRQPRRSMAARVLALLPRNPFLIGLMTVLLPCGALYAAIALAAATGSALAGAALMAGFSLTSALLVLSAGALASRLRGLRRGPGTRIIAVALIIGGILLAYRPIKMLAKQRARAAQPTSSLLDAARVSAQAEGPTRSRARVEDRVERPS